MNRLIYTGIGSRNSPTNILKRFKQIADQLGEWGYTLRSGGANGADSAFEDGCGNYPKEIYLPWMSFNGNGSKLYKLSKEAYDMAEKYHPSWDRLTPGAQKLHTRNCYQVLGQDLRTPSKFIVCWTSARGGTTQALRIAEDYGIPVFNFCLQDIDWVSKEVLNYADRIRYRTEVRYG